MTLQEAIEEVKCASKLDGAWRQKEYATAIATILNAVVKGELHA